jgi:hypothetical protein
MPRAVIPFTPYWKLAALADETQAEGRVRAGSRFVRQADNHIGKHTGAKCCSVQKLMHRRAIENKLVRVNH